MRCHYCGIEGCAANCVVRPARPDDGLTEALRLMRTEMSIAELVRILARDGTMISFGRENDRYLARVGSVMQVRGETAIELLLNVRRALL